MFKPGLAAALLACSGFAASPAYADTLQDALTAAYHNNPQLLAARASQRANDENVQIQRSGGLPSVTASADLTEFLKQNSTSFLAPERALNANVSLSVPIYSGGNVRNGVNAARNRVEAGRADLRGTESAVFSQVVAAYLDVIRNEALVSLNGNNVEVLALNLEATSDRFEIGDLTRTDVAQSQSRLALAQADLQSAQAGLVSARENYIALIGQAPADLQAPPPLPGMPESTAQAVETALELNPDIIAARDRVEAAGFDIEVAGSGRLPRLEAFASGGYQNFLNTLGAVPGTGAADQVTTSAQAGLRLSFPIFQGGRVAAQRRQASEQALATMEQAIGTERNVIAQVRGAYASWQASNAIIASSQAAVDAAALSLEGVRAENSVGNRTILDILDAQQELLRAQVQLVTARRNAYVAGFTLLAAMGKAEARDLGLGEYGPLYDPLDNYDRVDSNLWDWGTGPAPEAQSTRTVDIAPQGSDTPSQ